MLRRRTASATVVVCLLVSARLALAQQNNSQQFRPFNGFFADIFDDGNHPPPKAEPQPQHQVQHNYNYSYTPAGKSIPTRAPQPDPQLSSPSDTAQPNAPSPNNSSALPAPGTTGSSVTGKNYSFHYDDGSSTGSSGAAQLTPGASAGSDANASYTSPTSTTGLPLHERLKTFRESPFSETVQSPPAELGPAPTAPSDPAPQPADTPKIVKRTTLAPPPSEPPASLPATLEPQRLVTAKTLPDAAQEPSVLMDHKSPLLTVETIGPRKIVVGKEAAYEVVLQNSGDVAAEEVSVTIALPEWAEIASSTPSSGEVHPAPQDRHEPCRWQLGRIEARSKEKLTLKIIPKLSKPFELAVRWDFKQAPSQAMIEVQEPKLAMRLDGPREVLFGKREVFKLKLSNSGNGPAENVVLTLMPLNANDTHPITHRLGTINPNDERSIEIELTARQAGNLTIRVAANGDGGSHVDLAEHVLVHRGALQVDIDGPAVQYVGTPAKFRMRLQNSGDAPARNVKMIAKLPTGVKFLSGSEGAAVETTAEGSKVHWTVEQLQPGEQQVLEMKCTLAVSGANRIEITTAADDDLVASTEAVTRVEAMADLRMDVKDPDGPVPVGSEAIYELRLHNRGTKAAENVEVLAYFSTGVEPVTAEGQGHRIGPGQVVFDPIPAVAPAAELVFRIKAKADVPGNHVFRAEVHCKTTGTRLVQEEVTHFYQDGPTLQQAANASSAAPAPMPPSSPTSAAEPISRDGERTADRDAPQTLPQGSGTPLPTRAIRR
jgi:uncharacterized repeat protein (TIGR01451 family)